MEEYNIIKSFIKTESGKTIAKNIATCAIDKYVEMYIKDHIKDSIINETSKIINSSIVVNGEKYNNMGEYVREKYVAAMEKIDLHEIIAETLKDQLHDEIVYGN